MNKCSRCGLTPEAKTYLQTFTMWYVECECSKSTILHTTKEFAEEEWNAMNPNFPKCDTCEYFNNGYDPSLCIMHDRGTEESWTCPDHLKKDVTKVDKTSQEILHKYETANKTLLDTDFGESSDELLNNLIMVDRRDFTVLKGIEEDYARLADDYKRASKESREATESSDYWYNEWKKLSAENERLIMLFTKIKEIAEA